MLVNEIDRPNMGLTMDVGHMLMAGENPAQSISMVGDKMFATARKTYKNNVTQPGMVMLKSKLQELEI